MVSDEVRMEVLADKAQPVHNIDSETVTTAAALSAAISEELRLV